MSTRLLLDELATSGDTTRELYAAVMQKFLDSRDPSTLSQLPITSDWHVHNLARQAGSSLPSCEVSMGIAEAVAHLIKEGQGNYLHPLVENFRSNTFGGDCRPQEEAFLLAAQAVDLSDLDLGRYLLTMCGYRYQFGWVEDPKAEHLLGAAYDPLRFTELPPDEINGFSPMEDLVWRLSDEDMVALLSFNSEVRGNRDLYFHAKRLHGTLARYRPEVLRTFLQTITSAEDTINSASWVHILSASDGFEDECLSFLELCEHPSTRLRHTAALYRVQPDRARELLRQAALDPTLAKTGEATCVLAHQFPEDLPPVFASAMADGDMCYVDFPDFILLEAFKVAATHWDMGGKDAFTATLGIPPAAPGLVRIHTNAITGLLTANPIPDEAAAWLAEQRDCFEADALAEDCALHLQTIADLKADVFVGRFWDDLGHKSKQIREASANGLSKALGAEALAAARERLSTGKKIDVRLGGAVLLGKIGGAEAIAALRAALETEEKDKVRTAIQEALDQLGAQPTADEICAPIPFEEMEESLVKPAKRLKLPKGNWLNLADLPTLHSKGEKPLADTTLTFLLAKQSKHKTIDPAPDVLPILAHLDRVQTTDWALALFEQWLDSPQAAGDRWVLTLTGLLSDTRGISELKAPIQGWADNSRHKMAEYAAQAIGLIPGDEALMILDSLANRYRTKYKNIGRACRASLETAAENRGVSVDELGDLIVPDFDFNEERQRAFTWDGGELIAILGPDFKLSWLNPETEKETKSLPSSAPDEIKAEVKALNKLIREGIKGQTTRLELALVRQRRWPVPRWQELYEHNPILQSFAARLVWGVYNSEDELQSTFRRYPNGLLADAAGELIELEDPAQFVGLVHPLELEADFIEAWSAHLSRFKIKQPFPQLDRPVVTLDPLHGNRKEIDFTRGVELTGGTFRSRSEKRGWMRGSVVDAGGISSYYKSYPGAGVEVYLGTENFWVGFDPMDTLTLGSAYFAKADSIERGSYIYDEPSSSDDPRVLRFDEVSPVVYSETLSDLQAIVGSREK